ncbi:MAG: serine hydrolase, partial [Verrucomicrobiota bacterium]
MAALFSSVQAKVWTSADGKSKFEGELLSYDASTGMVSVKRDGKTITFHHDKLSKMDRAFLNRPQKESQKLPALDQPDANKLNASLRKAQKAAELPAIGCVVIVDGEIKRPVCLGKRKFGAPNPVTADDKWHIGSLSKSMTATLAATFVEGGELSWDSTVGEILGDTISMRDEYKKVTVKML